LRRISIAAVLLAALRCANAPGTPGSFYTGPSNPPRQPGDLIRSEAMHPAPNGAKVWRILYASTDPDGHPIAVSGVVIAPDLPAPPAGRPVLAWAHATTGVADACAPSVSPNFLDTIPHVPALVALDWVVVATDYPGLGTPGVHPYLVGESEGRAVLDSVRAAAFVEKSGAGKRCAVWGHSQGGHAALFAGQLAGSYAPELQLAGVAAIAPATELSTLLEDDLATHAGAVLTSYSLWTWSRFYGISIETAATPDAVRVIDGIARDCIETNDEVYRAGLDSFALPAPFLVEGAIERDPWRSLLERNRPGAAPIHAPLYVAQGDQDLVVRPSVTADYVAGLCREGAAVRFEKLAGEGHMRAARVSASSAIGWMRDRFEGTKPPNDCPPF
jgi:acetyl esterase/lipase